MPDMDEETDNEDGTLMDDDYYAFLNVPRDAPQDEITNAYRRLSKTFHPDKHQDPLRKKEAEMIFNKIRQAYEVLKDPHQRAIYDSVGMKGLETEGWEIIQRTKTPAEIREEYERLARQREERRLQQRTNPKGSVTVNVNAVDLFNPYMDDYDDEFDSGWPIIEVSGVSINQSIQAPLTTKDTATIAGFVNTHNGTGSGVISIANKRQISEKGWVEVHGGVGSGPLLGLKALRTLGKRVFIQGDSYIQYANSGLRAGLDGTLAMQVGKSTMGYLTWQTGSSSSMSTSIARDTERTHVNFTFLLGVPHSYVSLNFTWKVAKADLKIKSTVKAGTFGAEVSYGAEKKISEQSTVSASVCIGVPSGVTLRLRLTRATQNYLIPIQLCDEVLPSPVFYATVTPLLAYAIVKKLIIDPMKNEEIATKRQRQKDTYRNRMAEKRKEAQAAINLMSNTFSRIRAEEEARRGLVIVSAEYGKLDAANTSAGPSGDPSGDRGLDVEVIDVTVPLQCLVKDSKLIVHDSTKSQLAGFYDPCVGEDKHLKIQYLFHSQLHQTTIADNEPLRIPRQSHRINQT
uniref:DnaJ subfamily C member 11 n=2 Tax=Lygus hesperus TaxID=30085 RepID=A0A0K8TCV3_LYGHE